MHQRVITGMVSCACQVQPACAVASKPLTKELAKVPCMVRLPVVVARWQCDVQYLVPPMQHVLGLSMSTAWL